jgi:hypothetical protein
MRIPGDGGAPVVVALPARGFGALPGGQTLSLRPRHGGVGTPLSLPMSSARNARADSNPRHHTGVPHHAVSND